MTGPRTTTGPHTRPLRPPGGHGLGGDTTGVRTRRESRPGESGPVGVEVLRPRSPFREARGPPPLLISRPLPRST